MFGGKQAVDVAHNWEGKSADEQLSTAKEMGMVFAYMNGPDVWEKFCDTYEAIYDRLGEFDDYHRQQNTGLPSLQDEWPKLIDVVLSSMANRSKGTLMLMFQRRSYVFHFYLRCPRVVNTNQDFREKLNNHYNYFWGHNMLGNYHRIALPGRCPNLPRS